MALIYDGADGIFTRIGGLIYMMDAVRTHQNNLKTLLAGVQAKYSSADSWMIDQLSGNIESRIEEAGGILADIRAAAEKTMVEMCWEEANLSTAKQTMRSKSAHDALVWLIREMRNDSETVDANSISKSATTFGASNVAVGAAFVWATKTPNALLGGMPDFESIRSEVLEARCILDSASGAVNPGSEVIEVKGQFAYPSLDYRFPAGSGTVTLLTTVCASVDAGPRYQNILTNSDLEDQTSNLPDQWTVVTGTAGTHFATESTAANVFRGSRSLKLIHGTGALFNIRQQLGSSSGSFGRLTPDQPYVIAFAIKTDASCAGVIRLSLKDASGNILDGGLAATTLSLSGSLPYTAQTGTFRAPINVPNAVYFHLETTTTISGGSAYIDEIILAELQPIAAGGQQIAMIAGSTDFRVDDLGRFFFTNDHAGAVQSAFDRLFRMYDSGLQLPSNTAGAETILDTVISA
jgi:hypothetical protein